MTGRLEWPDPTPYISPEEEAQMEAAAVAARECQTCGGSGYVLAYCAAICECGLCPDLDDCPNCVGQTECNDAFPGASEGSARDV